jgi:RNA polymerase sigma-70 factor (ECF subfamily)
MPKVIGEHVPDDCSDLAAHEQGDSAAFGRLYDRHAAVVTALCRTLTPGRSLADAEDATQEVFLRVHRMLDRLDDCRGFRRWIYQIARLVCAERRRSVARRHKHEGEAMRTTHERERLAAPSHGAEAAAGREALDRLTVALQALPDDERLAIHLYYLDPDPVRAALDSLGVSRSGFYKLLTRAKSRLSATLERPADPKEASR